MAVAAEQPAAAPQPQAPGPPRRRLRRWLWRIAVFLIGTALLVGIVIQLVLWTGLPKSIVVSQVEKGLGLRMGAASVSSGWLGHTTLHGVKLALPLSEADQSF